MLASVSAPHGWCSANSGQQRTVAYGQQGHVLLVPPLKQICPLPLGEEAHNIAIGPKK